MSELSAVDKALARLYMAGCFHQWSALPDALSQLLPHDTPGKVGGPAGDAFDLVYVDVANAVRAKMHGTDPVLADYIERHLYGDVYSSPGLALRQKQVLMVAFLGQADMHEQLFGHLLAAMRFGNSLEACLKAIDLGFERAPAPCGKVYKAALKTLEMAYRKHRKEFPKPDQVPPEPLVSIPNHTDVCVPPLPSKHAAPSAAAAKGKATAAGTTIVLASAAAAAGEAPAAAAVRATAGAAAAASPFAGVPSQATSAPLSPAVPAAPDAAAGVLGGLSLLSLANVLERQHTDSEPPDSLSGVSDNGSAGTQEPGDPRRGQSPSAARTAPGPH